MPGSLVAELVRVEEDVSLVHEEEEVLVGIEALGDEDITDEGEGVVGDCDLDWVVSSDVLDDLCFPVHVTMDSKKLWITCHLVVDQSPERHGEDGVTWLLDCECRCTTSSDALVEYIVFGYL